ncbi:MAG: tRNA-(ms[2]io[6]A)-hydroxylase [Haliea sp.]|uniref:tRNA-(ms[2]io[6]A)-hydroxylase n=1 Tax=Haliea sp. TaxID=1932666 RepID=UPI0032EF6CEE
MPDVDALLAPVRAFLPCATPAVWVEWALDHPGLLLVDHANCEKKAASTALNLMYRYVDQPRLLQKLSRLAREELRHFEQVFALMQKRGVAYPQLSASRYAGELRRQVRGSEPGRLVDTLLVGALIEARSCERFAALIPVLDAELADFYSSLLKSEARHFEDYLGLAAGLATAAEIAGRLAVLRACEAALIESEDSEFRFHSGVPGPAVSRNITSPWV